MNLPKKILPILAFCMSIVGLHAQNLTKTEFENVLFKGGWHPNSREELLFSGVHTLKIESSTDPGVYSIRLAGTTRANKSEFSFEGTCKARFQNKYFELELIGDGVRKLTHYICGYIVDDNHIYIADSDQPFILTDAALKDTKWYISRR